MPPAKSRQLMQGLRTHERPVSCQRLSPELEAWLGWGQPAASAKLRTPLENRCAVNTGIALSQGSTNTTRSVQSRSAK